MRILIAGAGAVGQVYGHHLQRAGAEVHFWVKPKYREAAEAGFVLHPLNRSQRGQPERLHPDGVITDLEQVRESNWDQLWLAVSATAVVGDWVTELVEASNARTVICLQPGLGVEPVMRQRIPSDRLCFGLIAFIAYQAPLPGEDRFPEPGIAFWHPPGQGSPFQGPGSDTIAELLRRGGAPAAASGEVTATAAFGSALLQTHIAALDAAAWKWGQVTQGDLLPLASQAWREAAAIASHTARLPRPIWTDWVSPALVRLLLPLSSWVIPIDMETYLGYHFTKVGDQTRVNLDRWIALGTAEGMAVDGLTTLRNRMGDRAHWQGHTSPPLPEAASS